MLIEEPGVMEAILSAISLVTTGLENSHSPHDFTGGVEAAVSVIASSMSVILPAILRALDVGDPFMQLDTVELEIATSVEIARCTTLMSVELGVNLQTARVAAVAGDESREEAFSDTTTLQERDLGNLDERRYPKYLLTKKISDGLLGTSITTKVPPLSECDITDY